MHLSYSTTGPKGRFTPVSLSGSTGNGGVIEAYIGAQEGATMAPASTRTMTFRVALASNIPVSKTSPVMAFEAYLDQVNSASGSGSTLADTHVANVMVPGAAPTNTMTYVLIGVGVLVVVLLVIVLSLLWRRRKAASRSRARAGGGDDALNASLASSRSEGLRAANRTAGGTEKSQAGR